MNCGRFPGKADITIDNVVWQILELPNGFVKILNAYLDLRFDDEIVRVNVNSIDLQIGRDSIYCQFWFEGNSQPVVTQATEYVLMWFEYWGVEDYHRRPYLITCPFGDFAGRTPKSISLTANECDNAENNMEIIDNQPKNGLKKQFGVCTKQLSYPNQDFAMRFIEWIHLLRILGADKVYLRNKFVHRDFYAIMKHFEQRNFINVENFLEPSGISDTDQDSTQTYMVEQNVLNDCFYRIRNLYEYIVILDIDEMIMPLLENDRTWSDILSSYFESVKKSKKPVDSFFSLHLYFPRNKSESFADIPNYHYMLSQVQRTTKYLDELDSSKSFNVPDRIVVVHNHNPLFCSHRTTNDCRMKPIPTNISQLNHYRVEVEDWEIEETVEDKTIWKFKDQLMTAVNETLTMTNFKPKLMS